MKNLLIFLFILNTASSFSAKTYNLMIRVRDIYMNTPVQGCEVRIVDNGTVTKIAVNSEGNAQFTEVKSSNVKISILSTNGNYVEQEFDYGLDKKGATIKTVFLYPSDDFKNALTLLEDSIYGVIGMDLEANKCNDSYENEFIGGANALQRFVAENVQYPQESIELNEHGKVYLQFVIEIDGSITHLKVERGVSPDLDRESIRVVQSMPKWKPANCKGEPIRTIARMPIAFYLQ